MGMTSFWLGWSHKVILILWGVMFQFLSEYNSGLEPLIGLATSVYTGVSPDGSTG